MNRKKSLFTINTELFLMVNLFCVFLTLQISVKAQNEEIPYWGLRNIVINYPDSVYENFNPQYIAWGFEWDRVENPDNNFAWSSIDNAVTFTKKYGAIAVFLLKPTSSWASDDEPRAPNDLDRNTSLSDPVPPKGYSEALYDYTYKVKTSSPSGELVKYEPPDGYVYHGVGWNGNAQIQYSNMFEENKKPLLFQGITSLPGDSRILTVERVLNMLNPSHIDHEKQYAEISIHFYDDGKPVDSAFAFTTLYDSFIDTLAEALSINNRPVFLRIGLEMNGPWNGYTSWIFPKAFRKLVEGLRSRGIDDVAYVWCYEPDAQADFADSSAEGWKWYPGDDVVDWFGLDLFNSDHFDPAEPDSVNGNITKKGRSELFINFAEQRGKPIYLNELSAKNVYITDDQNDLDFSDGINDWQIWFEPFFQFLDLHPSVKAFNYIDLDWTAIEQYADWGDARIEINSYIKNKWVEKLSDSRFLNIGTLLNGTTNVKSDNGIPLTYKLFQNYPNPFNPTTKIKFTIPFVRRNGASLYNTKLIVYDILGREIQTLVNKTMQPNNYEVVFDGSSLASGIYFYKLSSGSFTETKKMLLIK